MVGGAAYPRSANDGPPAPAVRGASLLGGLQLASPQAMAAASAAALVLVTQRAR